MLKERIEQGNDILTSFNFLTLDELLNYIETTEPNYDYWGYNLSSRTGGYKFTKTQSLEEAIDLCRFSDMHGYDDLFKIEGSFDFDCHNLNNKRKGTLKQYGYRPNIARNMVGHPMQMYHLERDHSRKFINIFFNCCTSCNTSQQIIFNKGIITLNLIKVLELLNYRVNLNFFELAYVRNEWLLIKVNIKKFDDKLDPNICYFPMTHPSFLRRILFAVQETNDYIYDWTFGYGCPAGIYESKEFLNISDNDIIIGGDMGLSGNLNTDVQTFIQQINLNRYLDNNQEIVFDSNSKRLVLKKK